MEIEVGKKYVCREAPEVNYVEIVQKLDERTHVGKVHYKKGLDTGVPYQLYLDGPNRCTYSTSFFDLVEEYVEPLNVERELTRLRFVVTENLLRLSKDIERLKTQVELLSQPK